MQTQHRPDATTESAALRKLDLPDTRREWLRQNLPSIDLGGTRIYEASAVAQLSRDLQNDPTLGTRAIKSGTLPRTLHTR